MATFPPFMDTPEPRQEQGMRTRFAAILLSSLLFGTLSFSLAFLASCGGGSQSEATLSSIAVTPASPTIAVSGSQQFTATGTYSDASTADLTSRVTWSSSNTAAATISNTGMATGVAAGTTTITAASGSIQGHTDVTVPSSAAVSFTPSALTFSSQITGTTSAAQTITLTNTGSGSLNITTISSTGDFSQTNNCAASIASGGTCAIAVSFSPTAAGSRSGTLSVADDATGSPQTAALSGTASVAAAPSNACADPSGNHKSFPSCLAVSSPTAVTAAEGAPKLKPGSARARYSSGLQALPRASGSGYQTAYAAQTVQLDSLLNGTDANGRPDTDAAYAQQTLGTLGGDLLQAVAGKFGMGSEGCFGPSLYYSNHPDGGTGNPPIATTGQLPAGDLGIWLSESTDPAYPGEACSAAELNALLNELSTYTQFGFAIAAEMRFIAGSNLPSQAGTSYDVTVLLSDLVSGLGATIQSATISLSNDGTAYVYDAQFTLPQSGALLAASSTPRAASAQPHGVSVTPLAASVTLTNTGASQYAFSGLLQYRYDDGTWVTAGTARYQRTSQTNLNLSARNTFYPHGTAPVVDSNGELDPSDTSWTKRFSRFGASFDPTSPLLTGNYVFTRQINAPGQYGPGVSDYMTNVFQVALPGDGTGRAFYGIGHAIDQPDVGTIQYMYCERSSGQQMLRAQYQPFEFDSGAGEYVLSSTIPAQIRYAPTSSCTYTVSQWNDGNAGGFWYDRALEHANDASQPTPPTPIPEYVIADPNSADYPFNLFGDGSTLQPQINALGFTMPALY
jgi:hypothetical protein